MLAETNMNQGRRHLSWHLLTDVVPGQLTPNSILDQCSLGEQLTVNHRLE